MKQIALLGATGGMGNEFLKQALAEGYRVKALVRNLDKIKIDHPNLELIEGDVLQEDDVRTLIQDCEVVASLFGHVKNSPEWLQTTGTKNILAAMKSEKVNKIISLSGGGLPFPEKDQPKFIDKMIRTIMKIAVPKILNDAIAHAELLKKSNTNWIIVRGPRLTNQPKVGKYRVGWVGVDASSQIGRADLADFLLKQVESSQFIGQMPFVSY
jgi:putative NADH-flavin reductase